MDKHHNPNDNVKYIHKPIQLLEVNKMWNGKLR